MKKLFAVLLIVPILLMSCQDGDIDISSDQDATASKSGNMKLMPLDFNPSVLNKNKSNKNSDFADRVAIFNQELAKSNIQLVQMEYLGAEDAGNTVFFSNRGNKQLSSDFVPNDPRNWWPANPPLDGDWEEGYLAYWLDGTEQGTTSLSAQQTVTAWENTMDTWGSVNCSEGLTLSNQGIYPFDVGIVQALEGFGGFLGTAPGSIVHAGNLPPEFFDAFAGPGGGAGILGVTFTFVWVDDDGNRTDIDSNGKTDVFVREIYMNTGFNFQDAPNDGLGSGEFDYETVLLHEVGHGLSQGHFGKAFRSNGNGKLHFAPYALMNAGYTQGQRTIEATDNGGHCSNWGQWPNN